MNSARSCAPLCSVEALAEYIKKAAADEQLYDKHVAWKRRPAAQWSEVSGMRCCDPASDRWEEAISAARR